MEQDKSLQTTTPSAIQTPQNDASSPTPNLTYHIPLPKPTPKKSFLKSPLFWIVIIILFAFAGAYYFIYQSLENKVSQLSHEGENTKPSPITTTIPTTIPTAIDQNTGITLHSPDKRQEARFYYSGPMEGEGQPSISDVEVTDNQTKKTVHYKLDPSSDLANSRDGILYWSPIDNRIYFNEGGNGIGIFGLLSSKIDGTDTKLVAGESYSTRYDKSKAKPSFVNSAIWAAVALDYSPDGRTIVTARQDTYTNHQSPLWLMNYDGTNSRPVALTGNFADLINSVKWNSDGKHIVFTTWDGRVGHTYQVASTGGTPTMIK